MRFLEMALAFASLGFVAANAVLSLLTILLWRAAGPSLGTAGGLFRLRMLPSIGSIALLAGIVVPAFWAFEPRATSERAGAAVVFVVLAALLVAAGLFRAAGSWLQTRRLERVWSVVAVRSGDLGVPIRSYRVPCDRPFAALVGFVRPRLFVSDLFLDVLSAEERQAVLNHEVGHRLSLDNLKRAAMKLAPDWLSFSSVGREIEAAWARAAEDEADDHAAGPGRLRSLDVAGALLKASRLAPLSCAPVSNFCDGPTIARRVERLLKDAPVRPAAERRPTWRPGWISAALAAVLLTAGPALPAVYELTEAVLRFLR